MARRYPDGTSHRHDAALGASPRQIASITEGERREAQGPGDMAVSGSYTPFTTQHLTGAWAWGVTTAVWTIALLGAAAKLLLPGLAKGFWVGSIWR